MVEETAPSKEEVETDLQLSYITDKNNSLIEQITSQLQELDNISIFVDEKRAVFRHEQKLSDIQPENSGVNVSRNGESTVLTVLSSSGDKSIAEPNSLTSLPTAEYLQYVLEIALRQDQNNPQTDEASVVPDETKPFAAPLSHAQLIAIARRGKF